MDRKAAGELERLMRGNQIPCHHNNKPSPETVERYDEFMRFYANWIQDNQSKETELYMLGVVPGPAITVVQDQIVASFGLDLPIPCLVKNLPDEVKSALRQTKEMWDCLEGNHTPFNKGVAQKLLHGHFPDNPDPIRIGFLRFGYKGTIVPFGVSLKPLLIGEAKLQVKGVYNPYGLEVPEELILLDLVNGEGPVIKAVRTLAMMERNYFSRYRADGTPRS